MQSNNYKYVDMKSKIISIFLLTVSSVWLSTAFAQRQYTLDECIKEAMINNVQIKNATNELTASRHERSEAFTKYFPSLSAAGGGFIADKGLINMSLTPEMGMSLMKNGVVGGVSASIPLFTGGQIVNSNRLAEVGVEVGRLNLRQSENEVKLTTQGYFWKVVVMKEKLCTLSVVEEQLNSLRKDVQSSVDAGLTTRNDLLQVQLRQNEIRSTRIQIENMLHYFKRTLAQYIGHTGDSIDVDFTVKIELPEKPDRIYVLPSASLGRTVEYGLLQRNVEANRLQRRLAVGKNLPTVAVGGGYMYDNLMDRDHSFWMGFATVSIPLSGWWSGSHDIKKQELRLQNAENQLTDQSQLLILRMLRAWDNVTDAYQQVGIAKESIMQASENLRLFTDYYAAGTCNMSELLDAQTLYRQSRDKFVESYTQYEIKKSEYLLATGQW